MNSARDFSPLPTAVVWWRAEPWLREILGLGALLGAAGLVLFSYATEPWQVLVAWWLLIGPAGA
ncbi:MAG: hypothetical protein ACXW1Y_12030, partial [Acidimicrobiia bacterium]